MFGLLRCSDLVPFLVVFIVTFLAGTDYVGQHGRIVISRTTYGKGDLGPSKSWNGEHNFLLENFLGWFSRLYIF